ncbi:pirin family protein [Xylella taiwanensis]|uniref:Pirin n=1 Tax=Xylella taiwanensis TaxID=1444770 RepID=Z9JN27_9GAMM|nr:pirin family protein [Xylella taiwanensis]AXI83259.1 pirin [Xylella taiwanensis]EWS79206.1 pirin [Xylella taiwanensis]MCD8456323.1 pirin family protein [Xylella taiwanensis]MCD8458732.1 pirin family protein [Xylella taiwanensis]MCD8460866.1 pirin family protein [Xylella taiwanensis]
MSIIASLQRANHGNHFRAYGLRGMAALIDPFIAVDHAWMSAPTFPPHSHAGFSAVSYVFLDSETGIDNRDNISTHNLIRPGGVHWTTAGRGIIHEEVPAETGKIVHSLQIFVNLAREQQDIMPFALSLEPHNVPVVQWPGAKVRVPVGSFGDARSPLNPPTDVTMLDIALEEDAELAIPVAAGHCAFVMPIFGTVVVDGQPFEHHALKLPVFPAQDTPHAMLFQAPHGNAKVMLFSGPPLQSMSI